MPLRETMAAFLATQLDFIFFFYGLAFVLLGAVCFAIAKARGQRSSATALGLFGFIHGAGEWLDLTALIVADSAEFAIVRTAVMTVSFLFLMEFARRKAVQFGLKPPGPWLYLPLILVVIVGAMTGGMDTANALARYVIGFPAAIATCLVLIQHIRELSGGARSFAVLAAVSMALYGLAAGAIVPAAPFWPANIFDYAWFVQLTGIPIQLVRGLLACSLAFSLWALWGQLLILEVASETYTAHLRRQFIWTLAAMTTIVVLGWTLTEFLGGIYKRNIQETAQGDITLLASRLAGETSMVDGMVRALAGSPAVLPLLSGGNPQADRRARSVLDLNVEASGARLGIILDMSGAVIATSDRDGLAASEVPNQHSAPWFQKSAAGSAGYHFAFDPVSRERYYYASGPVRSDDGSIVGVAVLQKSLDGFEADLQQFSRPYFLINPDGIVVLTNRRDMMKRTLWPLAADRKSMLARQFGPLDDKPALGREVADATWTVFRGERDYVVRRYVGHSDWSLVIAMPSARIFASRILGIIVTLLVTIIVLIYFFGREHGVRDRIQMEKRAELQKLAGHLRLQATTDRLTGLFNRRKFDETLAQEISRSQRYGTTFALVLFDIDHFKSVNDSYGHQTGDHVLVRLSRIVSAMIRDADVLARWGGEEFVLLAPGADDQMAFQAAEKLRVTIGQSEFDKVGIITCSFGVAQYADGETAETLIARADNALYQAKANGRDRVELAARRQAQAIDVASVA